MIVAVTKLHYGKDFLAAAIRSSEGFADKHIVIYSDRPSTGFGPTDQPCPDTRDELLLIAHRTAGSRLQWVESHSSNVLLALDIIEDVDILLELDFDEVIHQDLCRDILDRYHHGELTHTRYRMPMLHHWRSFKYACRDPQWSGRMRVPKAPIDEPAYYPSEANYIHHFGYARKTSDVEYKWLLSVHRAELKPDWWQTWHSFPSRLTNLYPLPSDFSWDAEPFPDSELPAALIGHPYRYMECIE